MARQPFAQHLRAERAVRRLIPADELELTLGSTTSFDLGPPCRVRGGWQDRCTARQGGDLATGDEREGGHEAPHASFWPAFSGPDRGYPGRVRGSYTCCNPAQLKDEIR